MRAFLLAFTLALLPAFALAQDAQRPETGLYGDAPILSPDGNAKGVVFLFSGANGFGDDEAKAAEIIRKAGGFVVEVDLPKLAQNLAKDDGECQYLVSDVEGIGYQLHRLAGLGTYRDPIIAGLGAGAGLVLSIIRQTPVATIGSAIGVDPLPPITLPKPLCGLDRTPPDIGVDDILVRYSPAATDASRTFVKTVSDLGATLTQENANTAAPEALAASVIARLDAEAAPRDRLGDLPLIELPVTTPSDTFAIIYSGDGGWRDLDRTIGKKFQDLGMPTIGFDSLRYFWSLKPPTQTASDLAFVIESYARKWNAKRVVLIGYSFGADILPETYDLIPARTRAMVRQISLLGFSANGTFEISVQGWLGGTSGNARPALPFVQQIDPKLIQCFYGKEDEETACPKIESTGAEIIATTGGHHFDGDYDALAEKILDGLKKRP